MTTPGNQGNSKAASRDLSEPPVMRVIGVIDGLPVVKSNWLRDGKAVSKRLLSQLDDLGITIVDEPADYVI